MKVLVCGGRNFNDYDRFLATMNSAKPPISSVVCGGAKGADTLAIGWARQNNINLSIYNADWEKHGKAAGPIRNKEMLDKNPDIDLVIAFPGGSGTKDMIKRATESEIDILLVNKDFPYYKFLISNVKKVERMKRVCNSYT